MADYKLLSAPVRHLFMMACVKYKGLPCRVLEIGTWEGASALTWLEAGADLLCVDAWEDYPTSPGDAEKAYIKFKENCPNVMHIRGKSADVLPKIRKSEFDIVFIDGDHTYDIVKQDIALAMPLLRLGGIICGDDLNIQAYDSPKAAKGTPYADCMRDEKTVRNFHPGVTKAVAEIFGKVSMWGGFWAMQKIAVNRYDIGWNPISLAGIKLDFPSHFSQEAIADAAQHLSDIAI